MLLGGEGGLIYLGRPCGLCGARVYLSVVLSCAELVHVGDENNLWLSPPPPESLWDEAGPVEFGRLLVLRDGGDGLAFILPYDVSDVVPVFWASWERITAGGLVASR